MTTLEHMRKVLGTIIYVVMNPGVCKDLALTFCYNKFWVMKVWLSFINEARKLVPPRSQPHFAGPLAGFSRMGLMDD